MPKLNHNVQCVLHTLDEGDVFAQALLFPELSSLGATADDAIRSLLQLVEDQLVNAAHTYLYTRRIAGEPTLQQIAIELKPPQRDVTWEEPLTLQIPYVIWQHGTEADVAFVPALQIEVLIEADDDPQKELDREIRAAISRDGLTKQIGQLLPTVRLANVQLEQRSITIDLPTPKEIAQRELDDREQATSVFKQVASRLKKQKLAPAFEVEQQVEQVADALTGRYPTSVLLIGPSGVGKSAIVHEMVRRADDFALEGRRFWTTSGSRLVAGMSGFGMWQERCQQLINEADKTKAIVHLQNLFELVEVGKSINNSQGIGSFLRPSIASGRLLAIAECTEQQLPALEREAPQLLDAFRHVRITEPSREVVQSILLSHALASGNDTSQPITVEALDKLDRLHRRYATYSAAPGRPLRFLTNLLQDRTDDETIDATAVTRKFSGETGLPEFLLDEQAELNIESTRTWFHERVMGQGSPIELIVDMLATVKAGLTREGRPIASFLFIGPTGVGKTEMAKALSKFMYRDVQRMIRFDMSEYADRLSIERLIGGLGGQQGLLTSKVREQPFTVVLLDEFEKAHPSFYDLLLQVLGEGRLTDAAGRVADFTNSIIIMTSNLGVDSWKQDGFGFGDPASSVTATEEHFLRKVRDFVRPEFFNRIDRVVPFSPLDEPTIQRIAKREIDKLRRREGLLHRALELALHDDVLSHLATAGYDARYGARPLKRTIERELITPLASRVNDYAGETKLIANVGVVDAALRVEVKADQSKQTIDGDADAPATLQNQCEVAVQLRRDVRRVSDSPIVRDKFNQTYRLEERLRRIRKRAGEGPPGKEEQDVQMQLAILRDELATIQQLTKAAAEVEDELLTCFYGEEASPQAAEYESRLTEMTTQLNDVVVQLYLANVARGRVASVAVFAIEREPALQLIATYNSYAIAHDLTLRFCYFRPHRKDNPEPRTSLRHRPSGDADVGEVVLDMYGVNKLEELIAKLPDDFIGIGISCIGKAAYARMSLEFGLHVFHGDQTSACIVDVMDRKFVEVVNGTRVTYQPPEGIEKRSNFSGRILAGWPLRREYDHNTRTLRDHRLDVRRYLTRTNQDDLVLSLMADAFREQAWSIVDSWGERF